MCGFLGELNVNEIDQENFLFANKLIECRGPDSTIFDQLSLDKNNQWKCSVAFNRLSIQDLNNNANQPMKSNEFNSVLLFNGEIFNHSSLRKNLEQLGVVFKTKNSDTEVVLNGIGKFGISFIEKLIGQYSIVYFDLANLQIHLARDRLGQKPLFFKLEDRLLRFSSNLKSLLVLDKKYSINVNSYLQYLELGVIPSPFTLFDNLMKVEPGQIITVNLNNLKLTATKKKYWNLMEKVDEKNFNLDDFLNTLENSVEIRTQADVPIANFLSGGIDSSLIIKSQKHRGVNSSTFTVGYNEKEFDESKWAKIVSNKYNTNHHEEILSYDDISKSVDASIEAFDEPYSDPSTVPSYCISKKISKNFKVAISGDGGDELIGGYVRTSKYMLSKSQKYNFDYLYKLQPPIFGTGSNLLLHSNSFYNSYLSFFKDEKFIDFLKKETPNYGNFFEIDESISDYKKTLIIEYKLYLSEMMMLKVDRTSMANSLEVRSPFVDHRLVEFVLRSKNDYFDPKNPKKIFKEYLHQDFDKKFLDRKKMGFVFNIKKYVFDNFNLIYEDISTLIDYDENLTNIKKLNNFPTRINANRIWRIKFLNTYLNSINSLLKR